MDNLDYNGANLWKCLLNECGWKEDKETKLLQTSSRVVHVILSIGATVVFL